MYLLQGLMTYPPPPVPEDDEEQEEPKPGKRHQTAVPAPLCVSTPGQLDITHLQRPQAQEQRSTLHLCVTCTSCPAHCVLASSCHQQATPIRARWSTA